MRAVRVSFVCECARLLFLIVWHKAIMQFYIFDIAFWVNGSHEQNSMYHHNWIPLFVLTMQRKKRVYFDFKFVVVFPPHFLILHSWAAWPGMHIVFFLLYQFNGRHWSKSKVCAGSTHGNNNAGKSWMQLSFIYSYVVHCNPLGLSYTATRKTKL